MPPGRNLGLFNKVQSTVASRKEGKRAIMLVSVLWQFVVPLGLHFCFVFVVMVSS